MWIDEINIGGRLADETKELMATVPVGMKRPKPAQSMA